MMSNISTLPDTSSISSAWMLAVAHLKKQKGRSCFNLIYSITNPGELTKEDIDIVRKYDAFAKKVNIGTATTVANTIFPLDTYLAFNSPDFYQRYTHDVFPRVRTRWGTYFDRMTRRRDRVGQELVDESGDAINPLEIMIMKLARRVKSGTSTKNHYEVAIADEGFELTTYLPERDCNYTIGGPCLSHLSFKIDDNGAVRLTAIYRSHYYLERALGNLLGLARLQVFVANEAKTAIGPLTLLATHAHLETSIKEASSSEVSQFLTSCGA